MTFPTPLIILCPHLSSLFFSSDGIWDMGWIWDIPLVLGIG
jgi:hypothetical protein